MQMPHVGWRLGAFSSFLTAGFGAYDGARPVENLPLPLSFRSAAYDDG